MNWLWNSIDWDSVNIISERKLLTSKCLVCLSKFDWAVNGFNGNLRFCTFTAWYSFLNCFSDCFSSVLTLFCSNDVSRMLLFNQKSLLFRNFQMNKMLLRSETNANIHLTTRKTLQKMLSLLFSLQMLFHEFHWQNCFILRKTAFSLYTFLSILSCIIRPVKQKYSN